MKRSLRTPSPLRPARRRGAALALVLAIAVGLAAPAGAAAQADAAEQAVAAASLAHLRAGLPAGVAALDPQPFCSSRLIGWSCPGAFRREAEALGYRLSGRPLTLVCLSGPESCRLVGAQSLVSLAAPQVERSRATQEAEVWRRVGARPLPVERRRVRLTLVRGPSGWRVEGEEPLPDG